MDTSLQSDKEGSQLLLRALYASGLPLTETLVQADRLGVSPVDQLHFAIQMIDEVCVGYFDSRDRDLLARVMVFGHSHPSTDILLEALSQTDELVSLVEWAFDERFTGDRSTTASLRTSALQIAGYPASAIGDPLPVVSYSKDTLPWLDQGRMFECGIDLSCYQTEASSWRMGPGRQCLLRDGLGPVVLDRMSWEPVLSSSFPRTWDQDRIRLFRIRGLRDLRGILPETTIVAVDCPDLAVLDAPPAALVLVNCPSLGGIPDLKRNCRILHLESCPGIRCITTESHELCVRGPVILANCPGLDSLPESFRVEGPLTLRHMGSIRSWPSHFSVGGDLRLQDCLGLEELPPIEVSGSIKVQGFSSLRRLAAGTVVTGHLDLRPCSDLEAIPRGIKVGGKTFLPPHLCREPIGDFEIPLPLLSEERDLYPDLHTLLLGVAFPELANPGERRSLSLRSEFLLEGFRAELRDHPGLETELLWIASEVWSDLAEERWERGLQHDLHQNGTDDLPLAWFRNLLYRSESTVEI